MGARSTKLPGLDGTEKKFVIWEDGSASLVAGTYGFWQRPSDHELLCMFAEAGRWYRGDWTSGEFEVREMGRSQTRG